jgi:Electron transfer DM13
MKGPRWGILFLGAVVVALLFTFPVWRTLLRSSSTQRAFPLASDAQRELLLKEKDRNLAGTAYAALLVTVPAPTGVPTVPGVDAILAGRFTEIDAIHRATGRVRLYRLTDQTLVLRLEDSFAVTNAPQLAVYLSGNEAPLAVTDLITSAASPYKVGELVGSVGEQQFTIPSQLRLDFYRSVVIVSEGLNQIYSVAVLQ